MANGIEWNHDQVEALKKLWDDGLTAKAIGLILGVSKNAIVGKAFRMDLKRRESPIKGFVPKDKRPEVVDGHLLGKVRPGQCLFPFGNPGEPDFYFCRRKALFGLPYCQRHQELTHIKQKKEFRA